MSAPIPDNLGDLSMIELFRVEAEAHFAALNSGLVALDHHTASPAELEALMRAAHSLKGAARIVGLEPAVRVAHAMEDAFSSAQRGQLNFQRAHLDQLLAGVDLLTSLAQTPETGDRAAHPQAAAVDQWLALFLQVLSASHGAAVEPAAPPASRMPAATSIHAAEQSPDRFLRVTADHLNRLLGLSGEALICACTIS